MSIIQGSAMQGASRGFYPKTINGSLRFNDDDNAYLSWTPDSAGNRRTWTWSGWVKRANIPSGESYLFSAGTDSNNFGGIEFIGGEIAFQNYNSGTQVIARTTDLFRDSAAWYHIVVAVDTTQSTQADRLKLYVNGTQVTSFDGSDSDLSLNYDTQFNTTNQHNLGARQRTSPDSYHDGYLAEVFFIDGTAHNADAFGETKNGVWVPKNVTSSDFTMGSNGFHLTFEDDATVEAFNTVIWSGDDVSGRQVTGVGFSPDLVWTKSRSSAVNHVLMDSVRGPNLRLESNTTDAEDVYDGINSFDSDGFSVGVQTGVNDVGKTYVAWCWDAGANNASTGHSSVTWTGNGGTQAISGLPFSPDLVWIKSRTQDEAQNHNLYDTVRGANVRIRSNSTAAEATDNNALMSFDKNGFILGDDLHHNQSGETYVGWAWDAGDNDAASNSNGTITSTVKSNGDFSVITYSGNGTNNSTVGTGLSGTPDFVLCKNRSNGTDQWAAWHKDLTSIQYYLQLNTTGGEVNGNDRWGTNEPTSGLMNLGYAGSTNNGSSNYVMYAWRNVTNKQQFGKYTGNASSTGPTVNLGFRPGLVMIKGLDRSSVWYVFDTSRQPFNDATNYTHKYLKWDSTDAEYTNADDGKIEITSTGFQIRASVTGMNASGEEYIYAAWAGSYSDFITDVNTNGTNTDSRVKASDATGFSIVNYIGNGNSSNSIGHGLSSTPDMIIIKNRDSGTTGWSVNHVGTGMTSGYLQLQSAAAFASAANNLVAVDSSTFSVGTDSWVNANGGNFIAYCWTATTNVSAFGSYTGSGSTGNSITGLGFKPAFLILKKTEDTNGSWRILDATRSTTNDRNDNLFANLTNVESVDSNGGVSFDSDGFTLNNTGSANANESGKNYIYAAFADTREAAFWLDQSSNDNDWQPVNLDHNDTVSDSPTDNFATLNPLTAFGSGSFSSGSPSGTNSLQDGNLSCTGGASQRSLAWAATIGATSGKYYCEITITSHQYVQVGVGSTDTWWQTYGIGGSSRAQLYGDGVVSWDAGGGNIFYINSTSSTSGAITATAGDVLQIAFDADTRKVWFGRNNTWLSDGNPSAGTNEIGTVSGSDPLTFLVRPEGTTAVCNFGQQPFKYGPPE